MATSREKAREIAERHFADPTKGRYNRRPNDTRPLIWAGVADEKTDYQWATLPWDRNYTYEIERALLED